MIRNGNFTLVPLFENNVDLPLTKTQYAVGCPGKGYDPEIGLLVCFTVFHVSGHYGWFSYTPWKKN